MTGTTAVPRVSRQDTAGEAVAALSQGAVENASDVVVLDGERFVGSSRSSGCPPDIALEIVR